MTTFDPDLNDLICRPPSILLDLEAPLKAFFQKIPPNSFVNYEVEKMIRTVWYAILHPQQADSALLDYTVRLRDAEHSFSWGVITFATILRRYLADLGLYHPEMKLHQYHFSRRHGLYCIVIRRDVFAGWEAR